MWLIRADYNKLQSQICTMTHKYDVFIILGQQGIFAFTTVGLLCHVELSMLFLK